MGCGIGGTRRSKKDTARRRSLMSTSRSMIALRVVGSLLLLVAGVRFAMEFASSYQASRLPPPTTGSTTTISVVTFSVDPLTLGLAALGLVSLIVGFRSRKAS